MGFNNEGKYNEERESAKPAKDNKNPRSPKKFIVGPIFPKTNTKDTGLVQKTDSKPPSSPVKTPVSHKNMELNDGAFYTGQLSP